MSYVLFNFLISVILLASWYGYRGRRSMIELQKKPPTPQLDDWRLPGSPQLNRIREDYREGLINTIAFIMKMDELFDARVKEITHDGWEWIDPYTDRLEPGERIVPKKNRIESLDLRRLHSEQCTCQQCYDAHLGEVDQYIRNVFNAPTHCLGSSHRHVWEARYGTPHCECITCGATTHIQKRPA